MEGAREHSVSTHLKLDIAEYDRTIRTLIPHQPERAEGIQ